MFLQIIEIIELMKVQILLGSLRTFADRADISEQNRTFRDATKGCPRRFDLGNRRGFHGGRRHERIAQRCIAGVERDATIEGRRPGR